MRGADLRTIFGHGRLRELMARDVVIGDELRQRLRAVVDLLSERDESEIRSTLDHLDDDLAAALVHLVTGSARG